MLKSLTIILMFTFLSCGHDKINSNKNNQNVTDTLAVKSHTEKNNSSTSWINNFKDFRNAVYHGDKLKVKTFIDFPIYNDNNEIWYLTNGGNEKSLEMLNDIVKPFPESEFDKYYNKIFTTTFIKSILKIKTEILVSKGYYETIELKDKETAYKTYASFDKKTNILTLNLAYETPIIVNDGENDIVENSEYNVIYYFEIKNNKELKFKQLRIAG